MIRIYLLFFISFTFIPFGISQEFADPLLITMNQEIGFDDIELIVDGTKKYAVIEFLEHNIGDQIFFNNEPVFVFDKLYKTSLFNDSAIVFELTERNEYIGHHVIVDSLNDFRNMKIRNGQVYYQVGHTIKTIVNEQAELFYDLKLQNAKFFDFDIRDNKLYIAGAFSGKNASMQLLNHVFTNDIVKKGACLGEFSNEPNFYACIDMKSDYINYYYKEKNKCAEAEPGNMRIGPNGIYYGFSDYKEDIFINESFIDYDENNNEDLENDSYLFRINTNGELIHLQTYNNDCEDNLHNVIPHKDSSFTVINQVTECYGYIIQNNDEPINNYGARYIYFAHYDFGGNYLWHHRVGKYYRYMPTYFLFNTQNIFRITFGLHKNVNNNDELFIYDDNVSEWDTVGAVKIFDFDIHSGELLDNSITIQNNHLVHLNDAVTHQDVSTYNLTFFDFHPSLTSDSIIYDNLPLNQELIVNIIYGTETGTKQFSRNNQIKLYPNPLGSSNQLFIDSEISFDKFIIYDQVGRAIHRSDVTDNVIEFPDINPGLYFISLLKSSKTIETKKLIKQ